MQPLEDSSVFAPLKSEPCSYVSTARLVIDSPEIGERLFLVVEGQTDKTFYSRFFNENLVVIYFPQGCDCVREIITELNPFYPDKLFGIVDSDYFTLNGIAEPAPNIFRTDWHDHEMWLVYKPGSLEQAYVSYGILPYHHAGILPRAEKGIENLSYIKWCHDYKKRTELLPDSIQQAGIDFGKSAMEHHFSRTIEESLRYLYSHQDPEITKIEITEEEVKEFKERNNGTNPRHLNVGHDILNALTHVIKKIKGNGLGKDGLYNTLSSNYGIEDFHTTALYADLTAYFATHSIPSPLL